MRAGFDRPPRAPEGVPAAYAPGADRVDVLGCAIDRVTLEQSVHRCELALADGTFVQQASINAAKVVAARRDEPLRDFLRGAELVNPDGVSVVWASRLLGDALPERVTGIDLMQRLLHVAEDCGYGVYILGADRPVLERAVARLRELHPHLALVGHRDGYFAASENRAVCAGIRAGAPKLLFVAMGSPRSERWLAANGRDLGVSYAMGVGGAVDVIAGNARRAPRLMRRLGLEWLFRLAQEPRRLIRRNLVSITFVRLVARELAARRRGNR